ncbi:MAG: hypothetical protein HS107_15280 [Thermoflexaceae bacterium]|nr:hypothetical protein [Thermoflexaceae bacterium]
MTAHRTTLLIGREVYERYRLRARQRGTTVSEEIRRALEKDLEEENPNRWLLDLTAAGDGGGHFPPVDSDEAREQMVRDIYRDAMNREPDW